MKEDTSCSDYIVVPIDKPMESTDKLLGLINYPPRSILRK